MTRHFARDYFPPSYRSSGKQIWVCQKCQNYVFAGRDGRPLGIPGDQETRLARIRAHEVFDQIWFLGYMDRPTAYRWLGRRMRMQEAHIGNMGPKECEEVIRFSKDYLARQQKQKAKVEKKKAQAAMQAAKPVLVKPAPEPTVEPLVVSPDPSWRGHAELLVAFLGALLGFYFAAIGALSVWTVCLGVQLGWTYKIALEVLAVDSRKEAF